MKAPQLHGKYNVAADIIINVPISSLWNVLKDFGNVSDWAPAVSKSYYLTEQTSGVGVGRHCDIDGFGGLQEYVTHWHEGQGFAYSVTPLGPLAASNSSWWLTRLDEQATKLEVILSYNTRFGLFGTMLHKLVMRKKIEKSLPETIAATKKYAESVYVPASLSAFPPRPLSAVSR